MKKIQLFILLEVIFVGLIAAGMWLFPETLSFTKGGTKTITILRGNDDGTLQFKRPKDTLVKVTRKKKITWKIAGNSNVRVFHIKKKDTSGEIFGKLNPAPGNDTNDGSGTVDDSAEIGRVYSYDIFWKKKNDTTRMKYDPKLAVKSNGFTSEDIVIYCLTGILFLLPFSVFRTKKASIKR